MGHCIRLIQTPSQRPLLTEAGRDNRSDVVYDRGNNIGLAPRCNAHGWPFRIEWRHGGSAPFSFQHPLDLALPSAPVHQSIQIPYGFHQDAPPFRV